MNLDTATDPAALVHRDARDTEEAARASILPVTGRLRLEALRALWRAGDAGLTDDEGGRLVDPNGDRLAFGRRRHELVESGWAAPSDARRMTPSGRRAVVWTITDAGRAAYEAAR